VTAADHEAQISELRVKLDALAAEREHLAAERERLAAEGEHFRKLYLEMLEVCRKLELGIVGPKRERLSDGDAQLTMSMLGMLLEGAARGTAPTPPPTETEVAAHTRAKPDRAQAAAGIVAPRGHRGPAAGGAAEGAGGIRAHRR